jgi:hypothetical protein
MLCLLLNRQQPLVLQEPQVLVGQFVQLVEEQRLLHLLPVLAAQFFMEQVMLAVLVELAFRSAYLLPRWAEAEALVDIQVLVVLVELPLAQVMPPQEAEAEAAVVVNHPIVAVAVAELVSTEPGLMVLAVPLQMWSLMALLAIGVRAVVMDCRLRLQHLLALAAIMAVVLVAEPELVIRGLAVKAQLELSGPAM